MPTFAAGQLDYIAKLNGMVDGSVVHTKVAVDDDNFNLDIVSSNPRITLDAGDYIEWNRAGNYLRLPSGPVQFCADTSFTASLSAGNPVITFDSTDYASFDRASNQFNVTIGGSVRFQMGAGVFVQYNSGVPSFWMVDTSLGANLKIGRIVLSAQDFVFSKFNDDFATNSTLATITSNGQVRAASAAPFGSTVTATNGAGAATGTLTNAPVAGNPTKWVPYNDNGTTRYQPMW